MSDTTSSGYAGFLDPRQLADQSLAQSFFVNSLMTRARHVELVLVKSVAPGGVGPVGTVSVQVMVNQVDGNLNPTAHGTIFNVPYFRLQGGVSAVVLDPVAGDIGLAVFCDKDISGVKRARAPANPGSRRRFNYADGLYIGGFLNGAPTQYVEFLTAAAGIKLVSPQTVIVQAPTIVENASTSYTVNSPTIVLNGQITGGLSGSANALQGSLSATGDMVAGHGSSNISALSHDHSGVTTGGANTGPPVPMEGSRMRVRAATKFAARRRVFK